MLKFITAAFIGWMMSRLVRRVKRRELGAGEFTIWASFWLLVLGASLWPHATDRVAWWLGIGRGADLLVFLSIVTLFSLAWWLLTRVQKIEREITAIVRETALRGGEAATAAGGAPPAPVNEKSGGGGSRNQDAGERYGRTSTPDTEPKR